MAIQMKAFHFSFISSRLNFRTDNFQGVFAFIEIAQTNYYICGFKNNHNNTHKERCEGKRKVSTFPPHNMIERRLQHKQQILVFHITWKMMLKSLLSNNSSIPHSQCLINQCAFTAHCSNKTPSTLTQLQLIHLCHV